MKYVITSLKLQSTNLAKVLYSLMLKTLWGPLTEKLQLTELLVLYATDAMQLNMYQCKNTLYIYS